MTLVPCLTADEVMPGMRHLSDKHFTQHTAKKWQRNCETSLSRKLTALASTTKLETTTEKNTKNKFKPQLRKATSKMESVKQ